MDSELTPKQVAMAAKVKLMDYMAQRDHSVKELRQKLRRRFENDVVEEALSWAEQQNWLPDASALAEKVASSLHRKYKGIHFINQYLREKGLPPVPRDSELELEKARHLVDNKSAKKGFSRDKIARFLASRGFDSETLRKVIYEKR